MTLRPIEHIDADVAVIGSGFSGSLVALALRRVGQRVVILERGRHPRFAIGESSTPLANLLLEELADRYDLPSIRAFSKWGTWQRTRPDVACGLKRGFTFLFHAQGALFKDDETHARQLMVAASPHDEIADTHWYRPDFDHALVREAQDAGAIYVDEAHIDRITLASETMTLDGVRRGRTLRVSARFVVDASGPRGCLHRALGLAETPLRWLLPTHGLYAHFTDVGRWDQMWPPVGVPPYPPDDAALHHVFPGGWIWVLRFNNGITSAGAALTDPAAASIGAHEGALAWDRLLTSLPSVHEQFRQARATMPFVHVPRLAFRSATVSGPGWALLPSAAGVIDPLLSTGFPLTLLGVARLLQVLEETSSGSRREEALAAYEAVTIEELDVTERLVGALYRTMSDPPLFKRLALLYFAAASYAEASRRLGRPERAPGFLLEAHPRFGPELRACAALASAAPQGSARQALFARIDRAIEPVDVAGLHDRSRADWYPVLADDLVANREKLDATIEEIYMLLARTGFAATGTSRASHHNSASSAGGPTMKSA
jgi:tetracycline 7-halogenase / FADH2 O2-dependent halogenase